MIRADVVRFRCDVASIYTQWPVLVSYQAVCSISETDVVGRALASLPEVRVCVATLGACASNACDGRFRVRSRAQLSA
jgi:hypothetical protein